MSEVFCDGSSQSLEGLRKATCSSTNWAYELTIVWWTSAFAAPQWSHLMFVRLVVPGKQSKPAAASGVWPCWQMKPVAKQCSCLNSHLICPASLNPPLGAPLLVALSGSHLTPLMQLSIWCPLHICTVPLSFQTTDDLLVASAECPSDDEDIDPCEPSSGGLG